MEDLFAQSTLFDPFFVACLVALGLAPGIIFATVAFRNDGRVRFSMRSVLIGMAFCGAYCLSIRELPFERLTITPFALVFLVPFGNFIAVVVLRGLVEVWRLTGRLHAKTKSEPYLDPVSQEPTDTGKYSQKGG